MDYIERRRRAPTLSNPKLIESRFSKLDPKKIIELAIRDQAERVKRLQDMIEKIFPEEYRAVLWFEISGVIAGEVIIEKNQTKSVLREMNTDKARKRIAEKGDASKLLTRSVAKEKRGPNGEALSPAQLVKHVQERRAQEGLPPLGKGERPAKGGEDSATRTVRRHLKNFSY